MNIVRFNEPFEAPIKQSGITDKEWRSWTASPLFVHTTSLPEAKERYSEWKSSDLPPLPFPQMRFHVTDRDLEARLSSREPLDVSLSGFVRQTEEGWEIYATSLKALKQRPERAGLIYARITTMLSGLKYSVWAAKEKRWIKPNSDSPVTSDDGVYVDRKTSDDAVLFIGATVCGMSIDALSPQNHIAEVYPVSGEPRSVEWTRSRTHYTLISHGHPANRKTVQAGERVATDQHELTRMAHNRRAHYKTLKHERYRFARGKTIFVRATWVGPKEWQDEGGKQIYKILEPVDTQSVAA